MPITGGRITGNPLAGVGTGAPATSDEVTGVGPSVADDCKSGRTNQ